MASLSLSWARIVCFSACSVSTCSFICRCLKSRELTVVIKPDDQDGNERELHGSGSKKDKRSKDDDAQARQRPRSCSMRDAQEENCHGTAHTKYEAEQVFDPGAHGVRRNREWSALSMNAACNPIEGNLGSTGVERKSLLPSATTPTSTSLSFSACRRNGCRVIHAEGIIGAKDLQERVTGVRVKRGRKIELDGGVGRGGESDRPLLPLPSRTSPSVVDQARPAPRHSRGGALRRRKQAPRAPPRWTSTGISMPEAPVKFTCPTPAAPSKKRGNGRCSPFPSGSEPFTRG